MFWAESEMFRDGGWSELKLGNEMTAPNLKNFPGLSFTQEDPIGE